MAISPGEMEALRARREGLAPTVATPTAPVGPVATPGPLGSEARRAFEAGLPAFSAPPTDVTAVTTPAAPVAPPATPPTTTTTTTTTTTAATPPPPTPSTGITFTPRADARQTIAAVLNRFGLANLSEYLYGIYARQEVDLSNPDALVFAVRDTEEYKTRFKGNLNRIKNNLPELDPGSYIALEDQYRKLLSSNGLPAGFYDNPDDFSAWIEGDVSPSELQERIQQGYRAVADADPAVKAQMKELYDVSDGDLAAFFLDPKRARPLLTARDLTRRAQAAQIAARGLEQGGIQLTAGSAEELAARGVSPQQAQQQFAQMQQLRGLYSEMAGEEALTQQQKVGAAFGYDVEAARAIAQRKGRRIAEFAGGGGFVSTRGATSGTVETGAGTAQ